MVMVEVCLEINVIVDQDVVLIFENIIIVMEIFGKVLMNVV